MEIPESLIIQYFFQYSGYPEYMRTNGVYIASCPICREGKSWGKKKRLYFIPEKNTIYCHNCQKHWHPINWMSEVSGKSYYEILEEIGDSEFSTFDFKENKKEKKEISTPPLPFNSINLFNKTELEYYSDNVIVKKAIEFIEKRRLNSAINKIDLFLSLKDYTYKNRVCIPFYDLNHNIIFYQCRSLYKEDEENGRKYISKFGADVSVFNIHKIDVNFPYIFLFEGPIDSMFVKNGVGMAGLSFTETQKEQLSKFLLHKKIWVLDNQRIDEAAKKKTDELIKQKETVFIWPKEYGNYKDLNELCIDMKKDEINPDFFIKNSVNNQINQIIKSI